MTLSTSDSGSSGRAITLDQLIALNEEMAGLVRAGVPLERGLLQASREMGGRSGTIASAIGERLARGERLEDALAGSGHAFPKTYQAVIEAGLRSGQLAKALEGLAMIARSYAEARNSIGMALVYPFLVILLAYAFLVAMVVNVAPRFATVVQSLELKPIPILTHAAEAADTVLYWGPIFPAILAAFVIQWIYFGRSSSLDAGPVGSVASRLPAIGAMLRDFRSANFADLLALLIEHQVPLDEAVRLAGAASGNRGFQRSTSEMADRLRAGQPAAPDTGRSRGSFPPLLAWILGAGHHQATLPIALRQLGQNYRRGALTRSGFLRAILPTVLMVTLGGGAVILYAMLLFVPLSSFWDELTLPVH